MRKYVKPIAVVNSNLAEGVYAASGDCYTVSANITQTPAEGRQYYLMEHWQVAMEQTVLIFHIAIITMQETILA